jgi:hypothetical protein
MDQCLKTLVHIRVIRMDFLDDQDVFGDATEAEGFETGGQTGA